MKKTQLYLKVEFDHENDRDGQRLSSEIVRAAKRIYGVRTVEIQNSMSEDATAPEEDF